MITRSVNTLVVTHLKISYPILTVISVYCCSFSPPHHLCQHLFIFFIHTVCELSHFSFVFALLPSILLSLFLFSHSFGLFAPFLSHPVISPHCSHQSIYAYFCHVLRSPLTLPFPLSFAFSLFFPCAFLYLCLALSPSQLSLSFSSLQIIILFLLSAVKPFSAKWIPPSSLSPCLRSLFILIVLFQWQGGAAGLAPDYCCRHCWAMMVVVCECVWMGGI